MLHEERSFILFHETVINSYLLTADEFCVICMAEMLNMF